MTSTVYYPDIKTLAEQARLRAAWRHVMQVMDAMRPKDWPAWGDTAADAQEVTDAIAVLAEQLDVSRPEAGTQVVVVYSALQRFPMPDFGDDIITEDAAWDAFFALVGAIKDASSLRMKFYPLALTTLVDDSRRSAAWWLARGQAYAKLDLPPKTRV